MIACNSAPSQKREHESDGSTPRPKRKHPAALAKPPLKIIDLNDDCLEKIFHQLSILDLFNVAVANEWLRPAAGNVFRRRFGHTTIVFNANQQHYYSDYQHSDGEFFQINDLKSFLQRIRCLGSSIANLKIVYCDLDKNQCDYIDQYLNEYCAESLENISFVNRTSDFIRNFEKPFVGVQRVTVLDSCLGNKFAYFPQWFPNVRHLELQNALMDDRSIEMPLQHLQHLDIDVNNGTLSYGFTKKEAARLVRLCPLLESLEIRMRADHGMTMTTLLNTIKGNPLINKLIVQMDRFWTDVKRCEVKRLTDEHTGLVELEVDNYRLTADIVNTLIRHLHGLRKIQFQMKENETERFLHGLDLGWQTKIRSNIHRNFHILTLQRHQN